jgi:hypothetical protein
LVDPAEWHPEEYRDSEQWIYRLSDAEIAEIHGAVAGVEESGLDIKDIKRESFPLPAFSGVLSEIRKELLDGRGFVLVRGIPLEAMTRVQMAAAFWGLGTYLGEAVSQNSRGHLLGHVKDLGTDYAHERGYQTRAYMAFHADQCDILALCCLHPSKSGGAHRICSSVALHNEMLKRRPDLVKELNWKFYRSCSTDIAPGETPFYRQAIFNYHQGYFAARGVSANLDKAQDLPGVPKFTAAQVEAMVMYKELADELAFEVKFELGDIFLMLQHVTLHSRTAFEDWPEPERKRHVLRLWLTTHGARPLPEEFARQIVGVQVPGVNLKAPLDAE